jgi:hypothetical protein
MGHEQWVIGVRIGIATSVANPYASTASSAAGTSHLGMRASYGVPPGAAIALADRHSVVAAASALRLRPKSR